jgi:hypothetical protein
MKNAPKTSGTSKEEKHYVFLVDMWRRQNDNR